MGTLMDVAQAAQMCRSGTKLRLLQGCLGRVAWAGLLALTVHPQPIPAQQLPAVPQV